MFVRQGDKGEGVASVQKLLSLLGYDLIIDGDFGARTTRSIRSFQKKYGLDIDGIVGNATYSTLKAAQKRNSKESGVSSEQSYGALEIVQHPLSPGQYIKQVFDKKQIYLHFINKTEIKN